MKVTLIGLGKMGSVLAKRLLLAKVDLTVFNRTKDKMQPLTTAGAKRAETLKEAVENADIVFTCLPDDNVVLETTSGPNGFLNFLKPGAIHLCTSTLLPKTSKQLTELHKNQGSIYIAGPLLGAPNDAEKGELYSAIAGDTNATEKCEPLIRSYAFKVANVGTNPYQANVVKICLSYLLATVIETMGELYTFAEKSDVDTDILTVIFDSIFAHPAFKKYIDKIKLRNFDEVNHDLRSGYQDVSIFQQAFADAGVTADIADAIKNKFIIALSHGMADKDWSAITEITRDQANLK